MGAFLKIYKNMGNSKKEQENKEELEQVVTETEPDDQVEVEDPVMGEQEPPQQETSTEESPNKKQTSKGKKKPKRELTPEEEAGRQFFGTTETTSQGRKATPSVVKYNEPEREVTLHVYRYRNEFDENGEPKGHLPAAILNKKRRPISSVFKSGGAIVKGLSRDETEALLPEVIDESPGTTSYDQAVRNYFVDKTLRVDPHGASLRVGKDKRGNIVPLEDSIQDYITYRWLMDHPEVSFNKSHARKNPNIHYYIVDPDRENEARRVNNQMYKEALVKYYEVSEDSDMRDAILKSFGEEVTPGKLYNMNEQDRDDLLFELSQKHPERFKEVANDDDLHISAEIEEMVGADVIQREGTQYFFLSDKIGSDREKAIAFMKDPENSATTQAMRRKLQEYKSKYGLD